MPRDCDRSRLALCEDACPHLQKHARSIRSVAPPPAAITTIGKPEASASTESALPEPSSGGKDGVASGGACGGGRGGGAPSGDTSSRGVRGGAGGGTRGGNVSSACDGGSSAGDGTRGRGGEGGVSGMSPEPDVNSTEPMTSPGSEGGGGGGCAGGDVALGGGSFGCSG
eukprot:4428820-Prymnesium_polylepis.1